MHQTRENAVELFGIIAVGGGTDAVLPGLAVVPFRDIGALVRGAEYAAPLATPERIGEYRRVVERTFARETILPAPFGTIFRTRETLARWLELHYFALVDALTFISDRVMVRVTARATPTVRGPADGEARDAFPVDEKIVDLKACAAEAFRLLRHHAVASVAVPTVPEDDRGTIAVASFLVDRDRWSFFTDMVHEESQRVRELVMECTGPWPPYDLIRMQFGG